MNLTLIAALISAAFAGAVGWGTASHFYGAKITEMELDYANERIAVERSTREAFSRYSDQIAQAQDEAKRIADLRRRDADRARSELERVRNAGTIVVRAAEDSPATCRSAVTTFDVVFAECSTRLTALAEDADRCVTDTQALIRGWPK